MAHPQLKSHQLDYCLLSLSPNHVLGLVLPTLTKCTDHLPYDLLHLQGQDSDDATTVIMGCEGAGTIPSGSLGNALSVECRPLGILGSALKPCYKGSWGPC